MNYIYSGVCPWMKCELNWTSNRCFVCQYVCMEVCVCTKYLSVSNSWDFVCVPDAFDFGMREGKMCVLYVIVWLCVKILSYSDSNRSCPNIMECFGSHQRTHIQQIRLIIQSKCVSVFYPVKFFHMPNPLLFLSHQLSFSYPCSLNLNPFNSIQSKSNPNLISHPSKISQIIIASPQFYNPFFFFLLQIDLEKNSDIFCVHSDPDELFLFFSLHRLEKEKKNEIIELVFAK